MALQATPPAWALPTFQARDFITTYLASHTVHPDALVDAVDRARAGNVLRASTMPHQDLAKEVICLRIGLSKLIKKIHDLEAEIATSQATLKNLLAVNAIHRIHMEEDPRERSWWNEYAEESPGNYTLTYHDPQSVLGQQMFGARKMDPRGIEKVELAEERIWLLIELEKFAGVVKEVEALVVSYEQEINEVSNDNQRLEEIEEILAEDDAMHAGEGEEFEEDVGDEGFESMVEDEDDENSDDSDDTEMGNWS